MALKRKKPGTSRARQPRKSATKSKSSPKAGATAASAQRLIDQRIRDLEGWRGETLARVRALILEADPDMTEEWKWSNPVWSHDGIVCTGEAYTKVVKLTFARGASIPDPSRLFNSSLEGNTRRAIDIREGEDIDAGAFKALVRAAVAQNGAQAKRAGPKSTAKSGAKTKPVKLLSGGNPQIAKADGDAPVQAYIAAMPGWKRDLGKRLDALIAQAVPNVRKAVKWNSPLYGMEGQGWFLGIHAFTHYVKVAFFRGSSLRPVPPGPSKDKNTRYLDIHEGDELDEQQFTTWVKQAAALPGWVPGRSS
ncbi:MAG TPA: DUF1801 domain-containing protein [Gemmatimonadaceae bacterium]|nr:DUF1801 domain-containing protein [Gemmatimonadaceae bacterium]